MVTSDISANCRGDYMTRHDTTIEVFHEFLAFELLLKIYKLIIEYAIVDSVKNI